MVYIIKQNKYSHFIFKLPLSGIQFTKDKIHVRSKNKYKKNTCRYNDQNGLATQVAVKQTTGTFYK